MATKNAKGKRLAVLKREVNLRLPLPKNRVGRILGKSRRLRAPRYLRDSVVELRRVVWPTRRESLKLTFAVIVFTLLLTLITAGMDFGFQKIVERIFL